MSKKRKPKSKKCETSYARKVARKTTLSDYPEVDDAGVVFPEEIHVAYAVCSKECERREFIVDGSTQICHYCGKMMFRIVSRKYRLASPTDISSD